MKPRSGRIVPPEDRCEAEDCQSSRRPGLAFCPHHAQADANRRAAVAWEARKRAWRERERAVVRALSAVDHAETTTDPQERDEARAAARAEADRAVAAAAEIKQADRELARAADDGATCNAHPTEGLLDCRACEAVAEDAIQMSEGGSDE